MGSATSTKQKFSGIWRWEIHPGTGQVGQVVHSNALRASPMELLEALIDLSQSSEFPKGVKLLLTGGGFIELNYRTIHLSDRQLRGSAFLSDLYGWALSKLSEIVKIVGRGRLDCDLIIGVDVNVNGINGVGQFALWVGHDNEVLVPKRFPVGDEDRHLAGVDSMDILPYPRILETRLGPTLILICHDVHAIHPRNRVLVGRANNPTSRGRAIIELDRIFYTPGIKWALNLVHSLANVRQTQKFRTSYDRLSKNIGSDIQIAAGFGFEGVPAAELPRLMDLMVNPAGMDLPKFIMKLPHRQ